MQVTQIPMYELVERFRRYLAEERKLSPRTVISYTRTVRKFVVMHDAAGGLFAADLINSSDITAFLRLSSPGSDKRSRGAWNLQLAALRRFFGYLITEGIVDKDRDPTEEVGRVKVRQAPTNPPSLDEVLILVDAVEERSPAAYRARNALIVQLLFHCSLRVSELVSLNLEQVQMNANEVGGYRLLGVRRKGDKRQHIVFNDVVATAIRRYLEDRDVVEVSEDEHALILSDRKKRISASSVRRMIRRYSELAGIRSSSRRVSPHTLRHASATEMERDGARPRVIQEHLGHASIQTTQRYLHTSEEEQRVAVNSIGARFKQRQAQRAAEDEARAANS